MRTDRRSPIALILSVIVLIGSFLVQSPALALTGHPSRPPFATGITSKNSSASAKQTEGRLEAAHGDLTGDTGEKIKGQAKQVQASAMQAGSDLKQGVKSVVGKLGDSTSRAADRIQ
jgi:uncharacterized protein YjbJ (UPF0337 family)